MSDIKRYHEKVSDLYSEDEFKNKIEQMKEEFHHLFDENTLAHMIVAEEGRNESAIDEISSIEAGEEATVEGEIVDLGTLRTFENDNGAGRVRNVRIDDGTGTVKVVFWDEDTERIENEFSIGDKMRVVNGYVQDKGYGKQISAGKWGEIISVDQGKKD